MSPPQFMNDVSPEQTAGLAYTLQYAHAAFPSGHAAFATVVALGLLVARPPVLVRTIGLTYPVFVSWLVIATGNHYWLDVLTGWVVALIAGTAANYFRANATLTAPQAATHATTS